MDTFKALQIEARAKRDKAIQAVQAEYRETVKVIRRLRNMIDGVPTARPSKRISAHLLPRPKDQAYRGWTAIKAAETALRKHQPLTLAEIVFVIQSHGCRSQDDPRALIKTIRESFRYHSGKFSCDADKRWSVL